MVGGGASAVRKEKVAQKHGGAHLLLAAGLLVEEIGSHSFKETWDDEPVQETRRFEAGGVQGLLREFLGLRGLVSGGADAGQLQEYVAVVGLKFENVAQDRLGLIVATGVSEQAAEKAVIDEPVVVDQSLAQEVFGFLGALVQHEDLGKFGDAVHVAGRRVTGKRYSRTGLRSMLKRFGLVWQPGKRGRRKQRHEMGLAFDDGATFTDADAPAL